MFSQKIGKKSNAPNKGVVNIYSVSADFNLFTTDNQQVDLVGEQYQDFIAENYALLVKDIYSLGFLCSWKANWNVTDQNTSISQWEYEAEIFNNDIQLLQYDEIIEVGCEFESKADYKTFGAVQQGQQNLLRARARRINPTTFASVGGDCGGDNFATLNIKVVVTDDNLVNIGSDFRGTVAKVS